MPTENITEKRENTTAGRPERGNRNGRRPQMRRREPAEFEDVVVSINRVSKTVKGGRRMRFAALVVVGDKKGRIGFGMGKATEVPDAIRKAEEAANKNVFRCNLVEGTRTVPHSVKVTHGSSTVFLAPAAPGTGVIAGGSVRPVLELAGYKDIRTKVIGTNNPRNVVYATIEGLKAMKTVEQIAKKRGKKVEEIL